LPAIIPFVYVLLVFSLIVGSLGIKIKTVKSLKGEELLL
jgi:hypothetical protein